MTPAFQINYFTYLVLAHTKYLRECFLSRASRFIPPSYLHNIFGSQDGIAAFFTPYTGIIKVAFRTRGSTFCNHVIHVVSVGSKKEMIRITTRTIIAFMKNVEPFRDLSFCKRVGHSVRAGVSSVYFNFSISSLDVYGACPRPTFVETFYCNPAPKSFFKRRPRIPSFKCACATVLNSLFMCKHACMDNITTIGV